MASATDAPSVGAQNLPLIRERSLIGIKMMLAFVVAFALLDVVVNPAHLVPLGALKLVMLSALAAAYRLVHTRFAERHLLLLVLFFMSVIAGSIVAGSVLIGDTLITIVLFSALSVVTAAMFPWGARIQFALSLLLAGFVLLNGYLVHGFSATLGYAQLGAVGFILWSNHLALLASRTRSQLLQANEELRVAKEEAEVAAREAREAYHEAQSAARARTAFLAAMSHELRTPLHGMLGLAQIILAKEKPSERRQHLELIDETGRGLLQIVNDVLDYSRIDAGRVEVNPVSTDVAAMLERVRSLLAPLAEKKRLPLKVDLDVGRAPHLFLDELRVRQVLLNVVGNAVKFTERGHVRVEAAVRESEPLALMIEVHDTGRGVSEAELEQIFDPFERGDRDSSTPGDGTGLGLSICRGLVEAMDGTIAMESELGVGSVVRISIPTRAAAAAPRSEMPSEGPEHALEVLVVEDNPVNQLVMKLMLEQLGHRPTVAATGEEAVKATREQCFPAIIMDLHMPDMEGTEAAERIIAECSSRGEGAPRIIACTASVLREDRERCEAAGMSGFLPKPLRVHQLARELARVPAP